MASILKIKNKLAALLVSCLLLSPALMAQTQAGAPAKSSMSNTTVVMLVVIMFCLLLIIGLLANVVINAAGYFTEKEKAAGSGPGSAAKVLALIGFMLLSAPMMAQTTDAAAATNTATADPYGGITATAFYLILGVIVAEVLVIFYLLFFLRSFLKKEKAKLSATEFKLQKFTWWDKFNSLRPMAEESNIDLGHDYDGIRELDNRLPPWWLYGFYITIIFAGIYLYRYHISHTAPLSGEEFNIAWQKGEEEKAAYLKKSANLVDENTVKLLTDANSLAEGKKIFTNPAFCVACHRADGGGLVGPNLTDDYWIYGGGVKDIFKTVKYGTAKGMKSWKDDLSPLQIQQVVSYVKSLHGTNPKDAKPAQGDFYKEDGAAPAKTDSTAAATDKKTTASIN